MIDETKFPMPLPGKIDLLWDFIEYKKILNNFDFILFHLIFQRANSVLTLMHLWSKVVLKNIPTVVSSSLKQ